MARYHEIANSLRRRVQSGELPIGCQLPAVRALAREYNAPSLNAINAAIELLEDEGLLHTEPGPKTFVVAEAGNVGFQRMLIAT